MAVPAGLVRQLRAARNAVALTGSGISAESGVPTFRDARTGLWAKYDPLQLATPEAYARDPALVWRWYAWRRELVASVEPNPGHRALAELATLLPRFTLITQNVDGLHQRAGSCDVVEFHGNITRSRCSADTCAGEWDPDDVDEPPACDLCGAPMRPDVVWFGEAIPRHALDAALANLADCDVFFSIGTSSEVQPAASLAQAAAAAGARVVELNPAPTPLSEIADWCLRGPAGELLPELVEAFKNNS